MNPLQRARRAGRVEPHQVSIWCRWPGGSRRARLRANCSVARVVRGVVGPHPGQHLGDLRVAAEASSWWPGPRPVPRRRPRPVFGRRGPDRGSRAPRLGPTPRVRSAIWAGLSRGSGPAAAQARAACVPDQRLEPGPVAELPRAGSPGLGAAGQAPQPARPAAGVAPRRAPIPRARREPTAAAALGSAARVRLALATSMSRFPARPGAADPPSRRRSGQVEPGLVSLSSSPSKMPVWSR